MTRKRRYYNLHFFHFQSFENCRKIGSLCFVFFLIFLYKNIFSRTAFLSLEPFYGVLQFVAQISSKFVFLKEIHIFRDKRRNSFAHFLKNKIWILFNGPSEANQRGEATCIQLDLDQRKKNLFFVLH